MLVGRHAGADTWDRKALTSSLHFPFLTCQWKGYTGSEGQYHASLQGGRDGACVVNYLHHFFTEAGQTPSVVDTCHFSVTSDIQTFRLWVHWRKDCGGDRGTIHHMKCIKSAFSELPEEDEDAMKLLVDFRKMLRNIASYATSTRLERIKQAIGDLRVRMEAEQASRAPSRSSSRRSKKSSKSSLFALPTPPASQAPPAKRLRQDGT